MKRYLQGYKEILIEIDKKYFRPAEVDILLELFQRKI